MFTCRCFIRKNTSDLRNKLKELGHTICICTEFNDARWLKINPQAPYTVHGVGYTSEEMPWKSSEEVLEKFEDEAKQIDIVDCGTNEELFLAIAALRDDSDYRQWFIIDAEIYSDLPKDSWFKATNITGKYHVGTKIDPIYCHKATVQELIKHFKDN